MSDHYKNELVVNISSVILEYLTQLNGQQAQLITDYSKIELDEKREDALRDIDSRMGELIYEQLERYESEGYLKFIAPLEVGATIQCKNKFTGTWGSGKQRVLYMDQNVVFTVDLISSKTNPRHSVWPRKDWDFRVVE